MIDVFTMKSSKDNIWSMIIDASLMAHNSWYESFFQKDKFIDDVFNHIKR